MDILSTHYHRLVFRIDNDAPKEYMERWEEFKFNCESGESGPSTPGPSTPGPNKYILEEMKTYCKLKQNKELPYLERTEGGLGGGNNIENKQIRFRDYKLWKKNPLYIDNDIIMDQIVNGENEIWTYEELDDIIYGFIKTANKIVEAECINGFIELKNKNGYIDSYF